MFFKKKTFVCLICGYAQLPGPLYGEDGVPDVSLICSCCGFQPGYDDDELGYTIESFRMEWMESGAVWFAKKKKPKQWDLGEQLKNIRSSI